MSIKPDTRRGLFMLAAFILLGGLSYTAYVRLRAPKPPSPVEHAKIVLNTLHTLRFPSASAAVPLNQGDLPHEVKVLMDVNAQSVWIRQVSYENGSTGYAVSYYMDTDPVATLKALRAIMQSKLGAKVVAGSYVDLAGFFEVAGEKRGSDPAYNLRVRTAIEDSKTKVSIDAVAL